jgi:hypothetical protein
LKLPESQRIQSQVWDRGLSNLKLLKKKNNITVACNRYGCRAAMRLII